MELLFPGAKGQRQRKKGRSSALTPRRSDVVNFPDGAAPCPEHSVGIANGILGKVIVIRPPERYGILPRLPGKFVKDKAQSAD
jgi:hypothetical protein